MLCGIMDLYLGALYVSCSSNRMLPSSEPRQANVELADMGK